jgi:arabinofuranosyltransferase
VNLIQQDPVSACVLAAGLALAVALGAAWAVGRARGRAPNRVVKPALLGLGMAFGAGYAVAIGGDFMQGRFFAAPVFAATLLLWSALPRGRGDLSPGWVAAAVAVAGLLGLRALATDAPWFHAGRGTVDERAFYAATNTLKSRLSGGRVRDHERARQGLVARERAAELVRSGSGERWVETATAIGMLGYFAGPDVVVVDQMALADPLLARLPAWRPLSMRAGHPRRKLPKGYLESRRTGSLAGFDPELRTYYVALRRIVRDPLLDSTRLAEIARFHLGTYDPLLEAYLAKRRTEPPKPSRRRRGPN